MAKIPDWNEMTRSIIKRLREGQMMEEPKRYNFAFKSPRANKILTIAIPTVGLLIFFWPALKTIRIVGEKPEEERRKLLPSEAPPPTAGVGLRATSFRCLSKQVQLSVN